MNNSLIYKTVWRWRHGVTPMPILSDETVSRRTRELYLPVSSSTDALAILNELQRNGICASSKVTHAHHDEIPSGTLIVYAALSQRKSSEQEKKNIEKLKKYIQSQGGHISENDVSPLITKALSKLFNRGGK